MLPQSGEMDEARRGEEARPQRECFPSQARRRSPSSRAGGGGAQGRLPAAGAHDRDDQVHRAAVKRKAMPTEEIDLNEALEHAGVTPVETDLGEYIIQHALVKPSHIIAPAIHKTKGQ